MSSQIQPVPPAHGSKTPGSASGTISYAKRACQNAARTEKVWRSKLQADGERGVAYFWSQRPGQQPQGPGWMT